MRDAWNSKKSGPGAQGRARLPSGWSSPSADGSELLAKVPAVCVDSGRAFIPWPREDEDGRLVVARWHYDLCRVISAGGVPGRVPRSLLPAEGGHRRDLVVPFPQEVAAMSTVRLVRHQLFRPPHRKLRRKSVFASREFRMHSEASKGRLSSARKPKSATTCEAHQDGLTPERKGSERRIMGGRGKRPVVRSLAVVVVLASLSAACASNTTSNKDEGSGKTAGSSGLCGVDSRARLARIREDPPAGRSRRHTGCAGQQAGRSRHADVLEPDQRHQPAVPGLASRTRS